MVLVSGPVHLLPPKGVTVIPVRTAQEMRDKVFANLDRATIVIKAAAVADYHLSRVPQQKMKKTAARFSLELDPTPDILAELGRKKGDRLLVGFAAETENLAQEARRKIAERLVEAGVPEAMATTHSLRLGLVHAPAVTAVARATNR